MLPESRGDLSLSAGPDRGPASDGPMAAMTQSILVIDDERSFCDVVSEILDSYGYRVHQAYSAAQAEELLRSIHPDLMILDIMMPDVDGLTLIRRLRRDPAHTGTPIIVSSAKFLAEDRAAAMEAGANAYLSKPFSARDLKEAIDRLIADGSDARQSSGSMQTG